MVINKKKNLFMKCNKEWIKCNKEMSNTFFYYYYFIIILLNVKDKLCNTKIKNNENNVYNYQE